MFCVREITHFSMPLLEISTAIDSSSTGQIEIPEQLRKHHLSNSTSNTEVPKDPHIPVTILSGIVKNLFIRKYNSNTSLNIANQYQENVGLKKR